MSLLREGERGKGVTEGRVPDPVTYCTGEV